MPFNQWPAEARLLLGMVALWCALGLVVLGSASWWVAAREMGDPTYYLKRQAIWLVASWGLLYLGLRINLRRWLRLAAPALLIGAVLVALARADALRERYRRGGAGAPVLADVVTAYGAVAPKEG